jgi:UDPglucose--hexose-1-phosphate uridylyltransferase
MPELRKDPVIDRWVIISTERGKRPMTFEEKGEETKGGFCPFDSGNEDKTPPEITAIREHGTAPNTPGWQLRIVPNKFPALMVEGDLDRRGDGMYDKMNGIGAHEVIIETPDHSMTLADLPLSRITDVMIAYRDRMADLKKDRRFRFVMVFKNQGSIAGASLPHTHSQLIALPEVPIAVLEEIEGAQRFYAYKERCIFCDIISEEISKRTRLVCENPKFVAVAPYAPRFPFETWIFPKAHLPRYEEGPREVYESLAHILSELLLRINKALRNPPYNYILHTSPFNDPHSGDISHLYHWHIEVMPRLTKVAGFEWGSGFYINPTPPEEAAEFLREVEL